MAGRSRQELDLLGSHRYIRHALKRIEVKLDKLLAEEKAEMETFTQIEEKVSELEADVASVADELRVLAANMADPAKAQELADRLEAVHTGLLGAVTAAKHAAGM